MRLWEALRLPHRHVCERAAVLISLARSLLLVRDGIHREVEELVVAAAAVGRAERVGVVALLTAHVAREWFVRREHDLCKAPCGDAVRLELTLAVDSIVLMDNMRKPCALSTR